MMDVTQTAEILTGPKWVDKNGNQSVTFHHVEGFQAGWQAVFFCNGELCMIIEVRDSAYDSRDGALWGIRNIVSRYMRDDVRRTGGN